MKSLKMKEKTGSGFLISFCGLDGCGKTTMIDRLSKDLFNRREVFLTKQPTSFVRESEIFRTYMDSSEHDAYDYRSLSLLAASDRIQHVNKIIAPEIEKGNYVISDRYFYSCLANLRARGFKKDKWIYEIAEYVIKPDIAFFLDVPVDLAIERVRSRPLEKDKYIDIDLQYKLRNEYIDICKKNGGILISSTSSPDKTYEQVWKAVEKFLEEAK